MAYRSTITLSDRDQEILEQFKKELGIESSSQAIATAVKIAEYLRASLKDGNEIEINDKETGRKKTVEIIGLH